MTKMTGSDCVVMCNLINTHTYTHTHSYPETRFRRERARGIRGDIIRYYCCSCSGVHGVRGVDGEL